MATPVRNRTILLEIRPGDGGADAETFAGELAAALAKHATKAGATVSDTTSGRTITLEVASPPAGLADLAGIHRIQRIPPNGGGKRHTSTVTVAVVDPDDRATRVAVDPSDVRVDTFRASGAGGQHRNRRDSAVRAVHVPSGVEVVAADSRSQHDNRAAALAELERRLSDDADRDRRRQAERDRNRQFDPDVVGAKTFVHNAQRDQTVDQASGRTWRMRDFLKGKIA
jgi:peptide chain release factor 1